MKYHILAGLLFLVSTNGIAQNISKSKVRSLYYKAVNDEAIAEKLIKILNPYNSENNPLLLGYKASATMFMAKHSFNPIAKLRYFQKGKKMLQEAVEADNKNIELRFLRFAAQSNAPSFLGYDDHIQEDKEFLLKNVPKLNDGALKKYLISYLESSEIGDALRENPQNY